jgi:hypothetical protein
MKLDVVVEIAICVLIVWKNNACAIHFFFRNTCYPLHIVFQCRKCMSMGSIQRDDDWLNLWKVCENFGITINIFNDFVVGQNSIAIH